MLSRYWKVSGKIKTYTQEGKDPFLASSLIQDAVYRNFEIIGEATKRISEELRSMDANIPWRTIAGLRDVLIHQYDRVDALAVWVVIENDLDRLQTNLEILLTRMGENP